MFTRFLSRPLFLMLWLLVGCTGTEQNNNVSSASESHVPPTSFSSSSADDISSNSNSTSSLAAITSAQGNSSSVHDSLDPSGGEAYQLANGLRGAQLYAKFWSNETSFTLDNSQLAIESQLDNIRLKPDFFNCAHCHGWDLLGRNGGNSNLAPTANRPRVADVDLAFLSETLSPKELFDRIKYGVNRRAVDHNLDDYDLYGESSGDLMPDYSQILTDGQLWDIVKFLKERAFDTSALYDIVLIGANYPRSRGFANLGVEGDKSAGDETYINFCEDCHGADGTLLSLAASGLTLGAAIRSKPYFAQHVIRFGYTGGDMSPVLVDATLDDIQDLFAAFADKDKFPESKPLPPPEPEPEPQPDPDPQPDPQPAPVRDGLLAFLVHCSGCHTGNGEGSANPRYGDVTGASAQLINSKIQSVPKMHHLKPDDPAQAASLEEIDAIAEFLGPK